MKYHMMDQSNVIKTSKMQLKKKGKKDDYELQPWKMARSLRALSATPPVKLISTIGTAFRLNELFLPACSDEVYNQLQRSNNPSPSPPWSPRKTEEEEEQDESDSIQAAYLRKWGERGRSRSLEDVWNRDFSLRASISRSRSRSRSRELGFGTRAGRRSGELANGGEDDHRNGIIALEVGLLNVGLGPMGLIFVTF